MSSQHLTPSQLTALFILDKFGTEGVVTSTTNGASYVASGSAAALEKRGFARIEIDRYTYERVYITDEGRALLARAFLVESADKRD